VGGRARDLTTARPRVYAERTRPGILDGPGDRTGARATGVVRAVECAAVDEEDAIDRTGVERVALLSRARRWDGG
jgi:hypothetical protein